MKGFVYLKGLKQALERFDANGKQAKQGFWSVARGVNDLDWQLSYEDVPVIDCVNGVLKNDCLSGPMFRKCAAIIQLVYSDVMCEGKIMENDVTMGKVVSSGEVTVKKPFVIKFFNEDDGWVEKTIKPGTYKFRVLNVRGWKPRQLFIDGEWFDVMDECPELEELLNEATILRKADVKALPHGTLVRISGTGVASDDGDYLVDQESQAPGLVSKKDPKRKLYFNARFDRRIQDMLRQGVKFDVVEDASKRVQNDPERSLSDQVDETTTVASIAPTMDYLGHQTIVKPLSYESEYDPDEEEKNKKDDDHSDDRDWVSPIGRIFKGESVRDVYLSMALNEKKSDQALLKNLEQFKKIDSLDALLNYPGGLVLKTSYPYRNRFGMRFEDPDLTEFFGEVSSKNKNTPGVVVDVEMDRTKDGWEEWLDSLDSFYYDHMGDSARNCGLDKLKKNQYISKVLVKATGGEQ